MLAFPLKLSLLGSLAFTAAKKEDESYIRILKICSGYQIQVTKEDAQIDSYIENLIADVNESDISSDEILGGETVKKKKLMNNEEGLSRKKTRELKNEAPGEDREVELDNKEAEVVKEVELQNKEAEVDTKFIIENKEKRFETKVESMKREDIGVREAFPRPRPNFIYRFLLEKGYAGQTIVMAMVFISEFLHAFFPYILNRLSLLISFVPGFDRRNSRNSYSRRTENISVDAKYASFAADSRSIRGKQRNILSEKEDKEAAEQLRRIENLHSVRYRYVSDEFLRRHKLGPFQKEESILINASLERNTDGEEDVECENWVIEALTKDKSPSNKISTSVEFSNNRAKVGIGISTGTPQEKKSKSSRKRKSSRASRLLIQAAKGRPYSSSTKKRKVGPRISDREGGGGVIGRLRNISVNNLVSRSLLGAYPGDAIPPQEAASSDGVIELARKYGYGRWGIDDAEDNEKKYRRKSTRRHSRSFPSSRSYKTSRMLQFDDDRNSKKQEKGCKKRIISQTKRNKIEKSISSLGHQSKKSKIVRLPTTTLKEED